MGWLFVTIGSVAILTGWTVNQPNQAGPFQFDPKKHEPGTKIWLGHKIGSGQAFGIQGSSAIQAELAARAAACVPRPAVIFPPY